MKVQTKKIKWTCPKCKSVQISDPFERWTMDTCKCGQVSIDCEQYYTRIVTNLDTELIKFEDVDEGPLF